MRDHTILNTSCPRRLLRSTLNFLAQKINTTKNQKFCAKIKHNFKSQNTGTSSITTFEVKNVKGLSLQIQQFSHGFTFFIEMTFLSKNNSHWIMAQPIKVKQMAENQ